MTHRPMTGSRRSSGKRGSFLRRRCQCASHIKTPVYFFGEVRSSDDKVTNKSSSPRKRGPSCTSISNQQNNDLPNNLFLGPGALAKRQWLQGRRAACLEWRVRN